MVAVAPVAPTVTEAGLIAQVICAVVEGRLASQSHGAAKTSDRGNRYL